MLLLTSIESIQRMFSSYGYSPMVLLPMGSDRKFMGSDTIHKLLAQVHAFA